MPSVNEALRSEIIAHAIHSERYGKGLADKIVKLLNSVDADLVGEIASRLANIEARGFDSGPATTARIAELLNAVRSINDRVYKQVGDNLQGDLFSLAEYEAAYQKTTLANAITVSFPVSLPPAEALRSIVTASPIDGYLLSSWTDSMSVARLGRIEQVIRKGVVSGSTIDKMVQVIRGTRAAGYTDGVLNISRRSAQSLAVTATSTTTNNARLAVYQENKRLVPRVQWISVLDTRTTPFCQIHDLRVWSIDKPHPVPPHHINCRSVLVPVTASWRDLGIDMGDAPKGARASMDGQVPGETDYGTWLAGQGAARQDAVLGKGRADLFRSGKVGFADLFRNDGSYKSLVELKLAEGVVG